MRLFIAILLQQDMKDQLCETTQELKKYALAGNFTKRENYHLTLVFIGETTKIQEMQQVIDAVAAAPFTLQIDGLGKFARTEGAVFWAGVKKTAPLLSLYEQLVSLLSQEGFLIEDRPYQPHLTLGRKVKMQDDFWESDWQTWLPPIKQEIAKISLMKSERINGQLTYTELYARSLDSRESYKE